MFVLPLAGLRGTQRGAQAKEEEGKKEERRSINLWAEQPAGTTDHVEDFKNIFLPCQLQLSITKS